MDVLSQEKQQLDFVIRELNEIITMAGGIKCFRKEFAHSFFSVCRMLFMPRSVFYTLFQFLAFGDNFEVSVNFRTKPWVNP